MTITAPSLFDAHPEAWPADHPDQVTVFDAIAEVEAEQKAAAPFDYLAEFESIWSGESGGFSEAQIRASLADAQQTLADLNAKRITPRSVIGSGYKRELTVAREYLAKRIGECERDIATRGRTNSVNIANVAYRAPQGDPRKTHRVSYVPSDKYAHLWQAVCACGWHECGYAAVTRFTGRDAERHIAEATR